MKINSRLLYYFLFTFLSLIIGCQNLPNGNFHSLVQSEPYLLAISPAPGDRLEKIDQIELTFSHPIETKTVNAKSIFLLKTEINPTQYSTGDLIQKDLDKGKLNRVDGTYTTNSNLQKITWSSSEILKSGSYTLVITSDLLAISKAPFNQKPGDQTIPFLAVFKLPIPLQPTPTPQPNSDPPPPEKIRPTSLVMNEILYDSAESDTDGNEFVELYGTPNSDIDGYQLVIVNGSDGKILKIITFPENSKIPADGIFLIADAQNGKPSQSNIPGADFIDNFDPQNGPDAIQLLDDQGNLLDAVSYGEVSVTLASNGLAILQGKPAFDVKEGHSLSRIKGQNTKDNSKDFIDLEKPTPGEL